MGIVSTDRVLTEALTIENRHQRGTFGCMSRETGQTITVRMSGTTHSESVELVHAGDACQFPTDDVDAITVSAETYPAHVLLNVTNAPIVLTGAPFLAGGDPSNPLPVTF